MRIPTPSPQQIQLLPLTFETAVSADWLDVMGHMNVAYYTSAFSSAMCGFRSALGLGNQEIKKLQIGTFAIESHTRYLKESLVGDRMRIHTRLLGRSKSRKRFHALHFAINARGGEPNFVAATFEALVAVVDLKTRRMTTMPNDFPHQLDAKIAEHRSLPWSVPLCGAIQIHAAHK